LPVIRPCDLKYFKTVKKYIHEFELDDRALHKQQFLVLVKDEKLLAFGRLRQYAHFTEMCSLGVLSQFRNKGMGKKLVQALADAAHQPIYLVCVIPAFFESLGFTRCDVFPCEIREKLEYCVQSLTVPTKYVVMQKG
jgi:N-acetylglutamate synthase-like GNAT family acetyltransferase